MTQEPSARTFSSAISVVAVEIVTLLLLFALQQAFSR